MKKLLFILSALLVSVITLAQTNDNTPGLAYTLNPYAYDLKIKQWDESSQTLTVQFKLNAPPNLNGGDYNSVDDEEPNGIQIYAIDPEGNRYRIGGPGRGDIKTAHVNNNGQYEYTMDLSAGKSSGGANPGVDIPKNVPLTWEVQVKGRNNTATKGRKSPTLVFTDIKTKNPHFYPRAAHGIAIEKKPLNPHFGKIFVADACINHLRDAGYTYDGSSVLIYDPHLNFKDYELKSKLYGTPYDSQTGKKKELGWHTSWFSATTNYEPHRVCVSEDGRVFVSCYHPEAEDMVVELVGNDQFKSIIDADKKGNKDVSSAPVATSDRKYNRRVIAIDTKNSGDELTLLVAYLNPKAKLITSTGAATNSTSNSYWLSQVECYEYKIGKTEFNLEQSDGELVAVFTDRQRSDASTHPDYVFRYSGLLFMACYDEWNAQIHGFVDVAYDDDGDIWMKVDYGQGTDNPARICLFKQGGATSPDYTYEMPKHTTSSFYGANGILVTGNTLITGQSSNQLEMYTIDSNKKLTNMKSYSTVSGTSPGTKQWVTSIAEDFAGNIYALSEEADNIVVVAMPYNGVCRTPSPTGSTFTLSDPIPNILATDLRYAPAKSGGKYVFSFFTNTKPEYAEIRFYNSYDNMKQNLAVVNADNFSGDSISSRDTENLVCIYSIPKDKLKQGKIEVELGMVGGELNAQKFITNDSLPRGELYWSVYVQTRKSSVFAPIYQYGGITDNDNGHHRKHIAVNNYPETDMFGSLIVAHNPSTTDDATRANRGLHIYGINPDGNSNDEQATINNAKRYNKRTEYLNQNATEGRLNYPRRMAVAPDGKVYIADEGSATNYSSDTKNPLYNYWRTLSAERPYVLHEHGGVKIWDPDNPNKFTLFTDNRLGTSTGVAIWNGKLYATNTYDEYVKHINSSSNYTKEQQAGRGIGSGYGWNGFAEYILNKYTAPGDWSSWNNNVKEYALNRGDASGNCAIVAMDQGIWMCQHREHTVEIKEHLCEPMADNLEAYVLSFVPYNNYTSEAEYGPRTWRSCTTNGLSWSWPKNVTQTWDNAERTETTPYSDNSQKEESPLQSTPGAGLAYKKINDKEYLYVVNHDGNIVVFEIFNWESKGTSSAKPSVKHVYTYVTPESTKVEKEASKTLNKVKRTRNWKTSFITSMCFDYAGNLVTTTGKGNHDAPHDILVYTMPYDRTNAREIQAPNSCRYIPPRVSHLEPRGEIELTIKPFINTAKPCYVDIFRPMPNTSFSTICLPFDLDMSKLTTEKYKGAEVLEFTGVSVNTIGGEKILELQFSNISENQNYPNIIKANVPYIIKPEVRIPGIVQIQKPIQFVTMREQSLTNTFDDNIDDNNGTPNNSITYTGVIPTSQIEVRDGHTLILVAENRLAEMLPDAGFTNQGKIHGFRGYFTLGAPLPQGLQAIISKKDKTVTGLIDVNGQKVNIQKYLREGRVYIRMGDTLYTIDGQKVE